MPEKWDQHTQRAKGRSQLTDLINEKLAEVETQH